MRPENLTDAELVRVAERGEASVEAVAELARRFDNLLGHAEALARQEAAAEETGPMNQLEAMRDLCWNYEWMATDDKGLAFHIKGLHEDFHPDNHHVAIRRERKVGKTVRCNWTISVHSKECGEHIINAKFLGTLQEAQDHAVSMAVDGMVRGEWLNYGL